MDENVIFSDNVLDIAGICDPRTGDSITIRQAINLRILDVRSGEIILSDKHIPLEAAAEQGFIDTKLSQYLLKPGATKDSKGRELSLLEIIQSEINEAESKIGSSEEQIQNTSRDEKIITNSQKIAETLSINSIGIEPKKSISLAEAYNQGYMIKHESITIKSSALCLSDAISHGLVDAAGWISDRNSGEKFKLDLAVENQLIDANIVEVVDAKNDIKISVKEALKHGILNSKTGRYLNETTKEKLTFAEAKTRKLIVKPYTLKDVVDFNLVDNIEKMYSPMRRSKLDLMEAIRFGVLDYNNLKCISKVKGELITLQEAIKDGIIQPTEYKYRDFMTGEVITIPEAVERGLISSVSQKSIFNIDAFKDLRSNNFISFNMALSRDILCKKGQSFTLEVSKNEYVPLDMAVKRNMVRQEVYEMFTKRIGVYDTRGNELTVIDLCFHNLIDPKIGYLLDPKTGKNVPLDLAIENKYISPEGALFLSSLLNITLTTETVTRTVNRYVSIQTTSQETQEKNLTFADAVSQGLIDEDRQLYQDRKTGNVYSVQQALSYGLLIPDLDDELAKQKKPLNITNESESDKLLPSGIYEKEKFTDSRNTYKDDYKRLTIEHPSERKRILEDVKTTNVPTNITRAQNIQIVENTSPIFNQMEVTWRKDECPDPLQITPGIIFDPSTMLAIFTGTGQSRNVFEAALEGIFDENIISIFDTFANEEVSVKEAISRKVFDSVNGMVLTKCGESKSITEALKIGLIKVSGTPPTPVEDALHTLRFITDPRTGEIIPVEVAYEQGIVPLSKAISISRSLQKMRKIILKPTDALQKGIIDEETKDILENFSKQKDLTIRRALEMGIINGQMGNILDTQRNRILNINQAVEAEVIDPETSNYILVPLAKSLSIPKLLAQGLIDNNCQKIIHPDSGYLLNINEAIICDVLDPLSVIMKPKKCTLQDALKSGIVDGINSVFKIDNKTFNLTEAINEELFDLSYDNCSTTLPPIAMTFPVAVERKLLMPKKNEIKHPYTDQKITVKEAIESNIIMCIPYPPRVDAIEIDDALSQGLIDVENQTVRYLKTGANISIRLALEEGYLLLKPLCDFVMTQQPLSTSRTMETIKSLHTVTTKTIELMQGYILVSNNEVKNIQTGDICTVGKARELGILTEKVKVDEDYSINAKEFKWDEENSECSANDNVVVEPNPEYNRKINALQNTEKIVHDAEKFVTEEYERSVKENHANSDDKQNITFYLNDMKSLDRDFDYDGNDTTDTCLDFVIYTIEDAISKKIINPKDCRIIINGEKLSDNIETLLETETLFLQDEVEVHSESLVVLKTTSYLLNYPYVLTAPILSEINAYDLENEYFIDPSTRRKISFQDLVLYRRVFNPESLLVKNFTTGEYETLLDALDRPLLNRHNGHMVDPKTGKKIPFFECINRKWIIYTDPGMKSKPSNIENVVDPESGKILLSDGKLCSITDAINNGVIDIHSLSVRDPISGEIIPLRMAIELGVVNMQTGTMIDIQTLQEVPLEKAFKLGFLVAGERKPISLEAAIRKGLYNQETGKLYDSKSQNQVDIQRSIEIGLVDPKISLIVDSLENKELSLHCAIEDELVVPERGQVKDTKSNTFMPFDVGMENNLVKTDKITWSLTELLQREYYSPNTGKVFNPITGNEMLLQQAIELGFVELETSLIKHDGKETIVSGIIAAKEGLLDTVKGVLRYPHLTLDEAFVKGYLISTKKPLSLVDCLIRNIFDPTTSTLQIDGKPFNLKEAIALKYLNPDELIILDPKTDSIISLTEAITKGLLDPVGGYIIDPYTSVKMSLSEALDCRVLVPSKRKRSLPDAVYNGLYDPKSGKFSNSITREKLSTEAAIRRGIIDPYSTILKLDNKMFPFMKAVDAGIVDSKKGTIKSEEVSEIDFKEAFEHGILVEVKTPISLGKAISKNIYNESDGSITDPKTGQKLSLVEGINSHLIDINNIQLKDFDTEIYTNLDLKKATVTDIIDWERGLLVYNNKKINIKHAFEIGILKDPQAPISIQRALHQGLFDDFAGKVIDSKTGRKITLLEAIRDSVIDAQLPCYFDEVNEKIYNLNETCRLGVINKRDGVFKDLYSNKCISLKTALNMGLIVDIENAKFGLYEILTMGFFDKVENKIVHPITNNKLSLREACSENIVSVTSGWIKNCQNEEYVQLSDASSKEIINENGYYNLHGNFIDLQNARDRGLIVTNRRSLDLKTIISMKLYNSESGTFYDPSTSKYYNLNDAIYNGFINPKTTIHKSEMNDWDLIEAIENGCIDISKGHVMDSKTQEFFNYETAFSKGILVPVSKLFGESSAKQVLLEGSSQKKGNTKPQEMSLDEAIRFNILNPNTAFVRQLNSSKLIPFSIAQKNNLIDINKQILIDPKSLFFAIDPSTIVYLREPITFNQAVESKSLDLETGLITFKTSSHELTNDGNNDSESLAHSDKNTKTYSLKDAITAGIIDPFSALIKDEAKMKLVGLSEAFRKGIIDANKANVLNTRTSKLYTLQSAYESGLLVTPKRSFGLIEAIQFNLYNTESGCLIDPFQMNTNLERGNRFTLLESISCGLLDPSSTVVRGSITDKIVPLTSAINNGLIDGINGYLVNHGLNKKKIDLIKAVHMGLILPAEQRVS